MLPRLANRPKQLGLYALVERLAQGGMAAVYKAKLSGPSGFEKTVVVKALLPALCAHDELVDLFSAEARLSAQLNHPNIVQVIDFGVAEGTPYLVMEYLDGWTLGQLRDRLSGPRKGRFPVGAAVKIARDVCLALGYAHNFVDREGERRQVIHRDVSPSNVMLCRDGTVKLLDFGIARVAAPSGTDLTSSFRGKYAYMAPEQVRRQPLDRRVDVFAAGTVLHEMLTGKRLFASVSELETLERVAAAQVTAPSGENPEVPRALDLIVKKALCRERDGRYTSGTTMAEALDTLDSLLYSRKKLAQMLKQIFPEAWAVVCEVCGKQVFPGKECSECGEVAPPAESSASDADVQPLPPPPRLPQKRNPPPPHLFVVPKLPSRPEDDSSKMGLTPPIGRIQLARVPAAHLVSHSPAAATYSWLAEDPNDDPPTLQTAPPVMTDPSAAPTADPAPASSSEITASAAQALIAQWSAPAPRPAAPRASQPHLYAVPNDTPAPDLRRNDKGGRLALALLCAGLFGLGATLVWGRGGTPAPATPLVIRSAAPATAPQAARPEAKPAEPKPAEVKPVATAMKPVLVTVKPVLVTLKPVLVTLNPVAAAAPPARPPHRHHHSSSAPPSSTVREGRLVNPFQGGE